MTGFNPLCAGKGPEGCPRQIHAAGEGRVSIPSVRGEALKALRGLWPTEAQSSFNPLCAGKSPEGTGNPKTKKELKEVSIPSVRGRALKEEAHESWDEARGRVSIPSVRGRALKADEKKAAVKAKMKFQSPLCGEGP